MPDPTTVAPPWLDRVLASPHRPMFIAAGVWAPVVVVLTTGVGSLAPATSPLGTLAAWHAHEMVFGFAAAGFAGYTLTAMSSWSAALRPTRLAVAMLTGAWVLARLSAWGSLGQDPRVALPAGIAFMAFVTAILGLAALRSRQARGGVQALFAALLTGLQVAPLSGVSSPHFPVLAFGLLLSVVGGRMVAAFTWNQMTQSPAQARRFVLARGLGASSAAAMVLTLVLGLLGRDQGSLATGLLILASAAEAARLVLWQSRQVWQSAVLAILHLGYLWLPFGLVLVAWSRLAGVALPESDALHALAAGAIACSIYAVAARALARRGRHLRPAPVDLAGFALLWLAAGFRVFAPLAAPEAPITPILWCTAWALFLFRHLTALKSPIPHPVFSGPKN